METFSIGSPLMTLAVFTFAILLSFSFSVQSQPTTRNPLPPPSSLSHPPSPATKAGTYHHAPPPRKGIHAHRPNSSDKKHEESAKAKKNKGKLLGFLFAAIVVVLQIGVVCFLAYKRSQIYKVPK